MESAGSPAKEKVEKPVRQRRASRPKVKTGCNNCK